jgi:hypothetical protein
VGGRRAPGRRAARLSPGVGYRRAAGGGGHALEGFSIADPDDQGRLDVVGFDTATPQLSSDFARGAL